MKSRRLYRQYHFISDKVFGLYILYMLNSTVYFKLSKPLRVRNRWIPLYFRIPFFWFFQNGGSTNCVSKLPEPPTNNGTFQKCKNLDIHCTGLDIKTGFLYGLNDGKLLLYFWKNEHKAFVFNYEFYPLYYNEVNTVALMLSSDQPPKPLGN